MNPGCPHRRAHYQQHTFPRRSLAGKLKAYWVIREKTTTNRPTSGFSSLEKVSADYTYTHP